MTHDDTDLAAVRTALSTRWGDPGPALARTRAVLSAPASPRRPLRWLVPVAAAATVAGLALGSVLLLGGGEEATPAEIPRITDPDQIVFPMDKYHYTTDGYRIRTEALAYLMADCLARFGAEVYPAQLAPAPAPAFEHDRLFGVFDLEIASQWGYRLPPGWGEVLPQFPAKDRVSTEKLTEGEEFLVLGPEHPTYAEAEVPEDVNGDPLPADGCDGESQRILAGGLPDPDFAVTNNDAQGRAWHHPWVQAAEAQWSACMRRAGYDYESIWQPGELLYQDEQVTEAEIADAVANVNCKVETNLVGVLVAVTSQYEEEFIAENRDQLEELKLWLDTVYANSEQVIAEHQE